MRKTEQLNSRSPTFRVPSKKRTAVRVRLDIARRFGTQAGWIFRSAVLAVLALWTTSTASASTGFRITLPGWPNKATGPNTAIAAPPMGAPMTPAAGNKTGLVLTLDTTWVEGNGYRPVRVTIVPTTPTTADRSLRVSFRPGNYRGATEAVTRDIELPAGFTSVTATMSVPQLSQWNRITFEVFEDGAYVKELSIPQNYMAIGSSQFWGDNASPAVLVLNNTANANALLNAVNRVGQTVLQMGPTTSTSTSFMHIGGNPMRQASYSQSNTIPSLGDLPDRWLDYTSVDIILASRQDLNKLVKQHDAQWQAIRAWIRAGGNLWVYDVGDGDVGPNWLNWDLTMVEPWEYLDEINDLIKFDPAEGGSPWKDKEPALAGWRAPDPNVPDILPNTYAAPGQPYVQYSNPATTVQSPALVQNWIKPTTEPKFPFAMRPLGEGMVVAIPESDPTTNSSFPWRIAINNVGAERWNWSSRNGVTFNTGNDSFWNFLIPGVGAAPVGAFQILITLFVVAIGPINFYVLRRWHKLNLLLITVPVSAAVITLALFLYAILSDGLGVRTRTRSFTHLNQQTGDASCFGRMTYYAGLVPGKGLSFSGDLAVFPLSQEPIATHYDRDSLQRRLAWEFEGDDDRVGRQGLESGWLQARVQTQLVTIRSRKTDVRLRITETDGKATAVENQLGSAASLVVVCDAAGEYTVVQELAPDATKELTPVVDSDLARELQNVARANKLQAPEGLEMGQSHSMFGIRRRNYRRYTGMSVGTQLEMGILENSLNEALRAAAQRELPPRSYVAVVERSPEFESGLDSATDESSLHVIYGRW